jgi:hypothetical protein
MWSGGRSMKQFIKKQDQYGVVAKSGAKSIIDILLTDEKPKIIRNTKLYDLLSKDKKAILDIPSGTEFSVIDFSGDFLKITYSNGNSQQEGWVDISSTTLTKADLIFDHFLEEKTVVDQNWEAGRQVFEQESLKDYKSKNKKYSGDFDGIPKTEKDNYYFHTWGAFSKMIKERVADKKEMAKNLVSDYSKLYALDKIFDPTDMQNDQSLETNERKYANANFPDHQVSITLGSTPNYENNEDDSKILKGDGQWTATMEVLYPQEADEEVRQIILDIPLSNFLYGQPEDPGFKDNIELLAVMIAHEFIHTAQNTLLYFHDISKLPNLDSEEEEKRKALREILAYHYTLFPNKVYTSPELDPVFYGTNFVRGQSSLFVNPIGLEKAFLVWKALNYLKRFDASPNRKQLSEKYRLEEMRKDFESEKKVFADGDFKIEFDPNKGELKQFFATQAKGLNEDQMFMNYLFSKK